MKFSWERESDVGFCTLTCHPEEYDAYPSIPVLSMDAIPRTVSTDRLSVAFVLGFGYYASGVMSLGTPASAETANAVSDVWGSADVSVSPINYTPKAITYGNNLFKLNIDGSRDITTEWHGFGRPREFELRMDSISESYSSSFSNDVLLVPTNAHLVVPSAASADDKLLPFLAQAVLLSEDLDVGIIQLPAGIDRTPKMAATAVLLQTCGISLQFTSDTPAHVQSSQNIEIR